MVPSVQLESWSESITDPLLFMIISPLNIVIVFLMNRFGWLGLSTIHNALGLVELLYYIGYQLTCLNTVEKIHIDTTAHTNWRDSLQFAGTCGIIPQNHLQCVHPNPTVLLVFNSTVLRVFQLYQHQFRWISTWHLQLHINQFLFASQRCARWWFSTMHLYQCCL